MTATPLAFLAPAAIAVVGASKDPAKRGYQALRHLIADQFTGEIYPIHPTEPEILGIRAFPSVGDVPGAIDLALICTPAKSVPGLLDELGAKGVSGAVILAGGFAEVGTQGGLLEEQCMAIARTLGIRIVGPNTSGVFNLHHRMNLVGIPGLKPGGIGIVSQSGNMALSVVTEGTARGLGFSVYVGVGNQSDIRFNEYLMHLGEDENTAVVVLYVEGFLHGRVFLDVARRVTQTKPIVIYKSGRTAAGQASAKSHTGALAGSYRMTADLLGQAGVTVAAHSDHVVPLAEALALLPAPGGRRVAILADGGGHATIAADSLSEAGLIMAPLAENTRKTLSKILPAAASLANPVDVAGGMDANPGVLADCAAVILDDECVDALLIVGLFGGYKLRFAESLGPIEDETALRLGALLRRFRKPIVVQSLYAPLAPEALKLLRGTGVLVHDSIEMAVTCLAAVIDYGLAAERNRANAPPPATIVPQRARAILATSRSAGRTALLEPEALELLSLHGARVPPFVLAQSTHDVDRAADAFADQDVAMKVVSPDVLHKTDAGGVRLRLRGSEDLHRGYSEIMESVRAHNPVARLDGTLIMPMAPPGVEVIIGVSSDPVFGHVMMFGLGGVLVEVLQDVVFRAMPLTAADAAEMLETIKGRPILDGVRGAPPVDRAALIELMMTVSTLIQAHPEIAELDLNPVFAHDRGCTIVDARIILDPASGLETASATALRVGDHG